jgi:hypothetical protein
MRRSQEYRADYSEIHRLWNQIDLTKREKNKITKKEREMCVKHGLNSTHMFDPTMSYEQILREYYNGDVLMFATDMNAPAVRRLSIGDKTKSEEEIKNKLALEIDFSNVNSTAQLKAFLGLIVQQHSDNIGKAKTRANLSPNYKRILEAGDMMKKPGHKVTDVARKLFPEDFTEDRTRADHENAERKARNDLKAYRELVNGGYKHMSWP